MAFGRSPHLSVVSTDDGLTDAQLVAGVQAGTPGVATALVRRVGPRAKAAVRRLLRQSTADDDDLLQLVLIELVTTIDSFRGECSLNTWVDRIAAHVVYKRLRRQKLEHRLFESVTSSAAENVAAADSSERRALTNDVLERVRLRLAHLSEDKLAVWVLFEVQGFSLEELAHMLESTVSAVQSRVSRARKEVRACLEADAELLGVLASLERAS